MPKKNVIKKNSLTPTILVAGGAGFIGSHIAEAALKNKARVVVLDNFSTGKQIHVNHLLADKNFALYDIDINNGLPEDIESVDYIIHLAGLEEYLYSKEYIDLNSLLTSALGTKNLLDLAKRSNAKFLLVSTTDVYQGMMSQLDIDKYFGKTKLDENKYMITEAKRYAEALVWEYFKKHDTDARIVRLPEIYGPRMNLDASGQLGAFLKNIIEGKDITIFGDGADKEIYLYIADAVSGILKALLNESTKGNIYSLLSEATITSLELAYIVKGLADREMNVVFSPDDNSGVYKSSTMRTPDNFNISDLEWEPKTDIKSGIIKTLQWFGYSVNTHSFKPAKLIEEKEKSKTGSIDTLNTVAEEARPIVPASELFTLQDIKPLAPPIAANNTLKQVPLREEVPKPKVETRLNVPRFKFAAKFSPPPFLSKYKIGILTATATIIPGIFMLILLPAVQTFYNLKSGVVYLNEASQHASQFNSEKVKENSKQAYTSLYKAKKSFHSLKWIFTATGKKDEFSSLDKLISSVANFSRGAYYGANAVSPFESLWEVIRPDTDKVLDPSSFESAKGELANAQSNMLLAAADFKYVEKAHLPKKILPYIETYEKYLGVFSSIHAVAQPILSNLPEVLGSSEEKKYILLFQNSNEIRATGGFIGSYGVLTLEKGKIKELIIDDVYNPDGQLDLRNIQVDPPEPIKTYLKEDKLHIRNANWDPDFTRSAITIEDLYYRVTGDKVDGVIGLDLYFIENLLKITGPIFLTAYNEEITAENVYERAQFHSEFNYENGSDQKRSFLTVLGSKLLEKILNVSREQLPYLTSELESSLSKRHLLIYFSNNPLNALLEEKKWNGALVQTNNDYLYIVNSNLGGTKANYYVKNDYSYNVSSLTRDGVLRGELTLKYIHTADDTAWPGGPYTNFVRVYTGLGSKLTGATSQLNTEAPKDVLKEIAVGEESVKNVLSTGFTIKPGESITIKIQYDLPADLRITENNKIYNLYWQKQPGTNEDAFKFTFDKPFGTSIVERDPGLVLSGDQVTFTGTLNADYSTYIRIN